MKESGGSTVFFLSFLTKKKVHSREGRTLWQKRGDKNGFYYDRWGRPVIADKKPPCPGCDENTGQLWIEHGRQVVSRNYQSPTMDVMLRQVNDCSVCNTRTTLIRYADSQVWGFKW